ncbi:hypothetical protein G7Y89_g15665 [Cudoniella acicularis]|uniref:PKS/mFAS DH domain-containing protein n=1 Tax=Cudoniella acicularis TaxID=354080 RepID=A0A8H4QI44_9HELO|nr:hypothetical protein G7Y89_g15665 [Cudoniella acicularis]
MPWICGHKVEEQIVFPAAGYLGVAIEAISQILGLIGKDKSSTFEFRDVHIAAALVLPDDSNVRGRGVELHTSMSQRKLSTVTVSSEWYEFCISSWVAGHTTIHCAGGIRVNESVDIQGSVTVSNTDAFETYSADPWYEKAKEQGLCFEELFRSLTSIRTDGNRKRLESLCTTQLIPPGTSRSDHPSANHYSVHPITIDTCLQAPIISATGGNIKALRAYLPVFISEAHIRTLGGIKPDSEASIHTRSIKTSFSTQQIDSTLRDPSGTPFIDLKNVRFALYEGKKSEDSDQGSNGQFGLLRHPFLRTRWKPDILRLDLSSQVQVNAYVAEFTKQNRILELMPEKHVATVGALLDLAGHKTPRLRVMEIAGGSDEHRKQWLSLLDKDTAFPRCRSWDVVTIDEEGELQMEVEGPFDVIYIPECAISKSSWPRAAKKLFSLVGEHGIILSPKTDTAIAQLHAAQFIAVDVKGQILLARQRQPGETAALEGREIYIIVHKPSQAVLKLAASLENHMQHQADVGQVSIVHLDHINTIALSRSTICISMMEIEREFLASMGQEDMNLFRILTDTVTELLWLIGANMLDEPDPSLTMAHGLSRALMLEQPSLRFSALDLGPVGLALSNIESTCQIVKGVLHSFGDKDDKEYSQLNGLLYISRFVPDHRLNSLFRRRLGTQELPSQWKREEPLIKVSPARLSVAQVGITDSIHFQQICEPPTSLPPGFIDVDIKAVSLNAKDVYTVSGHVETKTGTTALEFSGIVAAVPAGHDLDFQPGDRVVVSAPNLFTTRERVPAWAAHKMLPEEEFSVIATLPVVYSTALYALDDRAHLRAGESILIHSGAGALGIALITIAKRIGAIVYTTVGSQAKRKFLVHELGIPETHIFSSRDVSFVEGIRTMTGGRGVDTIVSSLIGDLMHASWECIAHFGRFVEVGKRELIDAGKLNMSLFLRNATFTAFDLSELFFHQDPYYRDIWAR